MTELHQKYAPILRYNKGEQFFPMRADDLLKYSSLYAKGNDKPLVPEGKVAPADLVKHGVLPRERTGGDFGPFGVGVLRLDETPELETVG